MCKELPKCFLTALTFEQSSIAYIQVSADENGDIYCNVYSEQTGYKMMPAIFLFKDTTLANTTMPLTQAINRYSDTH